jgi:hypothetical protein
LIKILKFFEADPMGKIRINLQNLYFIKLSRIRNTD